VVAGSRRGLRWRREAYLTTLTEWAAISRGAFAPEEVVERGHSEEGPADIEFVVGGRRRCVSHPNLRDDFLNIAIISEINRLMGHGGYRFAVCDDLGMSNWVMALRREEEKRLRHELGWTFVGL
jgi:hypothetical protein